MLKLCKFQRTQEKFQCRSDLPNINIIVILGSNVYLNYLCFKNNFLKDNHCESLNVLSDFLKITRIFWILFKVHHMHQTLKHFTCEMLTLQTALLRITQIQKWLSIHFFWANQRKANIKIFSRAPYKICKDGRDWRILAGRLSHNLNGLVFFSIGLFTKSPDRYLRWYLATGFFVQLPLDSPYITMVKMARITKKIHVVKYHLNVLLKTFWPFSFTLWGLNFVHLILHLFILKCGLLDALWGQKLNGFEYQNWGNFH